MSLLTRIGISLILTPFACFYAQLAAAQVKIEPSNFGSDAAIQSTHEIRLKLDRLPTAEEGNLAIFIGRTDVTSQFRLVGTELIYQPNLFPLPVGETKLTVYLVKGETWKELAQLPLNVTSQQPPQPLAPSQPATQPDAIKPDADGSSQPPPNPTQPAQEPSQVPPQLQFTPSKPSTSAADLSNVFQPQPPQPQPTPLEPLQANPEPPPSDFTSSFQPRMNINVKSQLLEQRLGDTEASERPTFTDATIETGFDAEIASGPFTARGRVSMLGVTFQPEALRFGELGDAAPKFDLSEYQIDAKWGPVQFLMGHLCYGNHPFLLNNVCTRGMTFKVNFGDRVDVSINSMNATSIVGVDNITGLDNFDSNTIMAATVGYQLVKNDFGGIRLEATVMDGKRKPVSNFNEGEVVDSEKSRGFGFRLFGTDNSGRLRMDVGYARSTFTNPPDRQLTDASGGAETDLAEEFVDPPLVEEPLPETPAEEPPTEEPPIEEPPTEEPPIEEPPTEEPPTEEPPTEEPPTEEPPTEEPPIEEPPTEEPPTEEPIVETPVPEEFTEVVDGNRELDVVPVKPVTKSAFYADISYDLLKDVKLGGDRTLSLTLSARHERIDPQFQSLGATITADQLRTQLGFNASIAGATIQFQQEWSEDNLANVATVLKTKTRNTSLAINVPLQTVLVSTNRFLPTLSYSYQRVQQFGANFPIPELSGFDPTEIPNQVNQQHQAGIQWTFDEISVGYQFSSSFQDNRQLSRENADFLNFTHQFSLSWQPTPTFQLTLGYNFATATSKEEGITRINSSPTIGLSWEVLKNVNLTLNYNTTSDRDSLDQRFSRSTGLEAILTWRFNIHARSGSPIPGSAFIRYSRQSNLNRDNVFDLSTDSTIQVINAGLSLSF